MYDERTREMRQLEYMTKAKDKANDVGHDAGRDIKVEMTSLTTVYEEQLYESVCAVESPP